MMPFIRKTFRSLSSLKLTIPVLVVLIGSVIPAALIPQKMPGEYYTRNYPGFAGDLIKALGMDRFFTSPLFLILLGLFWINLFCCTVLRLRKQLARGNKGRYGPDLIHVGLLILIVASMISFLTRREALVFLKEGESVLIPGNSVLTLRDFQYLQYPDGSPRKWISSVTIISPDESTSKNYDILVNKPLRRKGLVFYQYGYRWIEEEGLYETSLMVTSDPGRIYILLSFLLISAGLMVAYLQKRSKE